MIAPSKQGDRLIVCFTNIANIANIANMARTTNIESVHASKFAIIMLC